MHICYSFTLRSSFTGPAICVSVFVLLYSASVSICTFVLSKCQYLYSCTQRASVVVLLYSASEQRRVLMHVQLVVHTYAPTDARASVCLLCYYKSTNADAGGIQMAGPQIACFASTKVQICTTLYFCAGKPLFGWYKSTESTDDRSSVCWLCHYDSTSRN